MAIDNEELLGELNRTAMLARHVKLADHVKQAEERKRMLAEKRGEEFKAEEGGKCGHHKGGHGHGHCHGEGHGGGHGHCHGRGHGHCMGSHGTKQRILAMLQMKEGVSQKEIAFLMGIRPQSVSEALVSLEAHELIERRQSADDRRVQQVFLTDKGRERAESYAAVRAESAAAILDVYTEEEKEQLITLLNKLTASLEQKAKEGKKCPAKPQEPAAE